MTDTEEERDTYIYQGDEPLGELHRIQDPNIDETQPTELETQHAQLGIPYDRLALDLQPGTKVTCIDWDEDRDLRLIEWTDSSGNQRITSVDLDVFDQHFVMED